MHGHRLRHNTSHLSIPKAPKRHRYESFRESSRVYANVVVDEPHQSTSFVATMRQKAMRLHTKDQAKSGDKAESTTPFQKWEYSREGYLRFLVNSLRVYEAFEETIQTMDALVAFRNTGMERVEALKHDIQWITSEFDLPPPDSFDDTPGKQYANKLREMAKTNLPAFLCHMYIFYSAHTAGGRMIGKKVADSVFSGAFDRFAFYQYASDRVQLKAGLVQRIDEAALTWTEQEKEACFESTIAETFQDSGSVLKTLFIV